jgi:chromate transporter
MAIHLGYLRAGWPGLIAGGLGFILPATGIVLFLAWIYARFGALLKAEWLLYGIKPVVIAIILQALWSLGLKAIRDLPTGVVAAAALGLYFLGINEVVLLFAGGLVVMLTVNLPRVWQKPHLGLLLPLGGALPALGMGEVPFSLSTLFLIFLKIGSVLYGSGYVLLAFLRADLVVRYGWLSDAQLLNAIAVGQVTPGPLFTTATFIGYQLGGTWGGLLATLGIFLPSFFFVAITNPFILRLRSSKVLGALLDGVNATALGLMAAVTWQVGVASWVDPLTIVTGLVALLLLLRLKVNSTWLIAGGALVGIFRGLFF